MKTHEAEIVFTSRTMNRQQPDADQMTKSVLRGRIAEGAGSLYLIFSAAVPEAGPADYTIKISGDGREALIRRKGAVPLRQPLFVGTPAEGTYETPFGKLKTEATALKIESSWDRETRSGTAGLIYEMMLEGQYSGRFRLDFRFRGMKQSTDDGV
ncbi:MULTISPECIES: DUF1934 domain-containing protein [unclassified Sporolactobacillus]|uniref:DUF1934 domain-containing protein n=1 Tax=unclassified Sporolactobacillus TaxID=2628533 RepID=UPI00236871A6|nr:DUF1934 domain-containing protein [Sporolactobacillus sp. CQH2019]MDD9148281.1 DUF1934 domain-containing protein [Sporolactobacillus sp. CQH2019]